MKLKLLFFLLFALPLTTLAQAHTNTWGCQLWSLPPKKPGESARASPDPIAMCPACQKIKDDFYKAQDAREEERSRQFKENFAKAQAKQKADFEARERDIVNRNSIATAKLNSLNQSDEAYERIRQNDRARRAEINNKFDQQVEASGNAYNDYLRKLQDASAKNVGPSNDDFWNETLAPANFKAVLDPKTRNYGFENKQKRQVIPANYDWARDIIKGVGLVRERPENFLKLINARGETIKKFDKSYFDAIGGGITGINTPDTIADGMMVTQFSGKNINTKSAYGCIDKAGNMVIAPSFYQIERFKNGIAIASKFLDEDTYRFENDYVGYFSARFTFVETGPINKQGKWLETPKKTLVYSYGHYGADQYLVVSRSTDPVLTDAEKKAQQAKNDLEKKKANDASFKQLEAEVQSRVSKAQSQGYLIKKSASWF